MYNSKRDNSEINNKEREQPKILIVEDDERLVKTLSDVLEAKGYRPIAVLTGREGVAAVKEEDISLALLDLKLPDISGIEVLKEIKKNSPRTEAIILTAFASLDTAMEAVSQGAFSYLQKPYDMERLLLDIRRALERRWAEEEIRTLAKTYSDLCDRSPIAIVNVYKNYRVDCTDRLLEWTGWSREEMEHINLVKESRFTDASGNEVVLPPLVATEMIGKTEKDYIPKLMRGETLEGVYQCYNRKDGGTVPLELNSVGYFGGKEPKPENFVHTICILANITERKQAEEKIRASLREKEVLLREIHHRVKNNLQIISSLLNMQARKAKDKEVIESLLDSRSRIQTMSLIHTQLYQSENFEQVEMDITIRKLVSFILQIYAEAKTNITSMVTAEGITLSISQAIPCGLIVNELVSNAALCHAFECMF